MTITSVEISKAMDKYANFIFKNCEGAMPVEECKYVSKVAFRAGAKWAMEQERRE